MRRICENCIFFRNGNPILEDACVLVRSSTHESCTCPRHTAMTEAEVANEMIMVIKEAIDTADLNCGTLYKMQQILDEIGG